MRNAIIRGMGNGYLQKQLVNDTVEIMSRKQGHENLIFNYFDQKNRKQGKVMGPVKIYAQIYLQAPAE